MLLIGIVGGSCAFADVTVRDLGDVDFGQKLLVLNNSGEVGFQSAGQVFYWTAATGRVLVGPGSIQDINDSGQIVYGSGSDSFIWTRAAGRQSLPAPPGEILGGSPNYAFVRAISNSGQIVGDSFANVVIWSASTRQITGYANLSNAYGVNDQGAITGSLRDGEIANWSSSAGVTRLGIFGAASGGINNSGQIAGYRLGVRQGFSWSPVSGLVDIPLLPSTSQELCRVYALNASGQVVGQQSGPTSERAFLWTPGSPIVAIDSLLPANSGWQLTTASDINDRGQIVGLGILNGRTRGFLLDLNGPPSENRTGLAFVPIAPCRVVDTRLNDGAYGKPSMAALQSRSFVVAGKCGIPAAAKAYSTNVTVVPKGSLGYLTLYPTGETLPTVSTLNSLDGRIKANAAIVPAGSGGAVSVYVTHETELIVDVNGYFVPKGTDPLGLAFYPTATCRLVDTRLSSGVDFGKPALAPFTERIFGMLGDKCVPAAKAYSVNATVVPSGPLAYLTLWPYGSQIPVVSTLNSLNGAIVANAAIVPSGTYDGFSAYATHATELIVDVNGYFGPQQSLEEPLYFYPVSPCRISDTRNAVGAFGGPIGRGQQSRDYSVPLTNCGVPASARAYSVNVTAVPQGPLAFLTIWAAGAPMPVASTLNALDGSITSNAAIVRAGNNGAVSTYLTHDSHLIIDINGYFAP